MGYYLKRSNIDNEGFILPSGPTVDGPATPITASIRYNTDTNGIEYFNGSNYVELSKTGRANLDVDKFTGDGITVTFTMTTEHNDYREVLVFIDGILQLGPGNYTTSGFDITFDEPPPSGLRIAVIHGLGSTYVEDANIFDVPTL